MRFLKTLTLLMVVSHITAAMICARTLWRNLHTLALSRDAGLPKQDEGEHAGKIAPHQTVFPPG